MKKTLWALAFLGGSTLFAVCCHAAAMPLANGDFSSGASGWNFWTGGTGAGAFTVEGGQAKIVVSAPGPNNWSVGFTHPGIPITQGRVYQVEFDAQADGPLDLVAEVHLDRDPWTSYSKQKTFALTAAVQHCTLTFTMRLDSDPMAALQLMMGGQRAATLRLDNAVISDLGADSAEPAFPAGLTDTVVTKGMEDCTVFTFSQVLPKDVAYQVFKVKPDLNIRTLMKWGTQGQHSADYDFGNSKKYHYFGTLYAGGITTIIQKHEFATEAEFQDMVTRDAAGEAVPWAAVLGGGSSDPSLYRGALANPRYRQYLVETFKMQIDGGVDSIFFDEANNGYVGGPARNWTNNEGFDDASIADFNRYLLDKYPAYTAADWKTRFDMDDANLLRRELPADDLAGNFNYRRYLQDHGWAGSDWGVNTPFLPANPLAAEWGKQVSNRVYPDGSFTSTYLRKYLKEIFDAVRAYGRDRYGKRILITANGILPEMDYNSLGIYQPNRDEGPRAATAWTTCPSAAAS